MSSRIPLTPVDAGRRLADPRPVLVEQPSVRELTGALRDRARRLRLPDPLVRVAPGTLADGVTVRPDELAALLRSSDGESRVIWSRAGSEIAVVVGKLTVATTDGGLVVTVPVQTDQTGAVDVQIPLALGTDERDAGLLAVAPGRPLGPAVVVDRWGEALLALVWRALLQVAVALAARAGNDDRGDPLVPASLRASAEQFTVVPIARHRGAR